MFQVYNATLVSTSYNGMRTPLHILAGSPGCEEASTSWLPGPPPDWSAYRACEDVAFGFVKVDISNATTMKITFINSSDGSTVDDAIVTKLAPKYQ